MNDGRQQAEAYAKLSQPAIQPGDLVDCPLGRAEVMEVLPGAMLKLRTSDRCPVMVKRYICQKVRA